MVRVRAAAVAACVALALPPLSAASGPAEDSAFLPIPTLHVQLFGRSGMVVREAVTLAVERIRRPRCESLIGELRDGENKPLAWNLSESGMTAPDYLAELRFVEGQGVRRCEDGASVALTRPGSRVIFVCGLRFAHYFSLEREEGAVIIIHELLHSLGLGENPPSSAEITDLVASRCSN